jgi:hypothetical protein
MSQSRRIVAALATLAVLVAAPATASAAPSSSKARSTTNVQVHVDKAATAVKRMQRHARLGNGKGVAKQLKIARSQSVAASRMARQMAATADPGTQSIAAAQALTLAGTQYDQLVESITAIVDQITGQVQALVANAIAPTLAGKQKIIEVLTQLLDQVPAEAKPMIASIIAALSVGDADEVVNLDAALDTGTLPSGVAGIVSQALAMATGIIDQAFAAVQAIVPMLPVAAQGPLTQILDMVTSTVATIMPSVLSTVTGLIDTVLAALPFVGATASASGGQPATGAIGGILNSVTGLIGNLLGGLLGGQAAPAT